MTRGRDSDWICCRGAVHTVLAAAEEQLEEERKAPMAVEELRGDGEPCARMTIYGTIGEFVEGNEDWTEYEERLGHFFSAHEITEEAKKHSILLSACGAKIYKVIRNLATPWKPGDIPYDELVSLVASYHNPKPSVIVQRFKFHSHFRKQGQSVANCSQLCS